MSSPRASLVLITCLVHGMSALPASAAENGDRSPGSELAPKVVGILLFDGVQIIDFTGPYEVFGQAGMSVWTASHERRPITTHMGLHVTPTHSLAAAPAADILVVPGGNVPHVADPTDPRIGWLRDRAEKAEAVLSVCNGVFLLTASGLLDGLRATTYAPMLEHLRMVAPEVEVARDERLVDNGKIVTAGGLSAGIDGALHLVARFQGEARARAVANNLEYDWQPERPYNRAKLADLHIQKVIDFHPPLARRMDEIYEGDESRWRLLWRVRWAKPVEEMRRQFVEAARHAGWEAISAVAGAWQESQWVFDDDRGHSWRASVSMTADRDGIILLSIAVSLDSAAD